MARRVLCDLEHATEDEVAAVAAGADAVVFTAGAGPGSGPERKWTVDYGAAVKLIAAARANGIDRYVMVSSRGADPDAPGDDTFAVYVRAKGKADAELRASGLAYTIVRPGRLTDDSGVGRIRPAEDVGDGAVSRDDVAAALVLRRARPGARRGHLRGHRRRHADRAGAGGVPHRRAGSGVGSAHEVLSRRAAGDARR